MKLAENNDGEQQVESSTETSDELTLGATPDESTEGAQADDTTDDEPELVVTIGEEAPASEEDEADSPDLVNKLRKLNREKDRQLRELRNSKAATPVTSDTPAAAAPVPRPTMEECNFEEDIFAEKLTAWNEQQAQAKAAEQKKADEQKAAQAEWDAKLAAYNKQKASLKVANYEDAEDAVRTTFSQIQQSILIDAAKNAAHVVAALGTNPTQLKKLASITSPVKFAYALAELETQLKVTPRKAPPPPEHVVRGSAPVSAGKGDAQLAKLEAEAERTGDRSKVIAFRREQRRAQS
jgi:hypothetical protein